MGYQVDIKYFNCFWLKKVIYTGTLNQSLPQNRGGYGSVFPGLPWRGGSDGYPNFPSSCGNSEVTAYDEVENWIIEESRYKGGYNNVSTDYGAKAYLKEDTNKKEERPNALIYSGLYNNRTGINNTNVFSIGEAITRAVDPQKGSVQRLYAEDTNLIVFQEDKVNRALIDKDTLYTSEGGTQTLPPGVVIGQLTPYRGEFGISKNPESFAVYGFRKYFVDKDRGSVLRLSHDGMTEISEYGMSNFFRDQLKSISELQQSVVISKISDGGYSVPGALPNPKYVSLQTGQISTDIEIGSQMVVNGIEYAIYVTATSGTDVYITEHFPGATSNPLNSGDIIEFVYYKKDRIVGAWDIHDKLYTVSLQQEQEPDYHTLAFDEQVLGWPTFYSYRPNQMFSIKNTFFSTKQGEVFQHYFNQPGLNNRNSFYGADPEASSITFVFNPQPNTNKNFLTIGYEGSNGWKVESFTSDIQGLRETPNDYIKPMVAPAVNSYVNYSDSSVIVNSYYEGAYDDLGNEWPATLTPPIRRAGFVLKEGKYVANLKSNSGIRDGEVIFGPDGFGGYPTSGIKGYVATVKISTDQTTDPGGVKQMYATFTNNVTSSN